MSQTRPEHADDCPECDGRLVSGQGLFACETCGWVGTARADGRYEPLEEREPVETERRTVSH